jgi:hypothetical protein
MAGIDDTKLRCTWLAQAIAFTCRGLGSPFGLAGQKNIVLGDPNNPTVDAVVDIWEPSTGARSAAVPGTHPTGSVKKTQTQIPMYHMDDGLSITQMDISQAMKAGEIPQVVKLVAAGVMENLTGQVMTDLVAGFFNYAGATNAIPSSSTDLRAMKKAVEDRAQGIYTPDDMTRILLVEPDVNNSLLGVSEFVIASSVGQAATMQTGRLNAKYGFADIVPCSYLSGKNVTSGTAANLTVNGDHAAGKNVISMVDSVGGTVKKGQIITFAGSAQKHTVRGKPTRATDTYAGRLTYADATLVAGTAQDIEIYPPLAAAAPNTTAITVLATHGVSGLGFHPMALASASRKFPDYDPGTGYVAGYATDDGPGGTGLVYRVTTSAAYITNRFAVDVCGGLQVVVPRWGARWIRTAN